MGAHAHALSDEPRERALATPNYREAAGIGVIQSLALLAGISRSGVTTVGGLLRGLSHEDAAKCAFPVGHPVILAAGVLKLPTLAGPQGDGVHGQILVGALVAGVAVRRPTDPPGQSQPATVPRAGLARRQRSAPEPCQDERQGRERKDRLHSSNRTHQLSITTHPCGEDVRRRGGWYRADDDDAVERDAPDTEHSGDAARRERENTELEN
ncbi:hypothetical protein CJ179_37255 [Rhodococcus sp. ACS1]|nr:hypothetical protein CJ179_37255 [Rhodococcus sp. ACS1]